MKNPKRMEDRLKDLVCNRGEKEKVTTEHAIYFNKI
jgi:hypothetical protein